MTEAAQPTAAAPAAPRKRSALWNGVLPEALGLGFVAAIFGGFLAAYYAAHLSWQQAMMERERLENTALAQQLAAAVSMQAENPDATASMLDHIVHQDPSVTNLRWLGPAGEVLFATAAPATPAASETEAVAVPVPGAAGARSGTLLLSRRSTRATGPQPALVGSWGIAALATFSVFILLYQRLRRHLRAAQAIAGGLDSYASGVEQELLTLQLSDNLGPSALAWNRLIAELSDLQLRSQGSGQRAAVLDQFESVAFRRVVDQLPYGVLRVTTEDNIAYTNASGAALLKQPAAALLGNSISSVVNNAALGAALAAVRGGGHADRTVDHSTKEGDHETTLRFRILRLTHRGAGGEALVTIEDISQLREGERARDRFLYHVTHELRTPLTNIAAYTETLTKPDFDDELTRKECYNVIISETRRLSHLVEDILSISQLEVGTARLNAGAVDFARLMREVVQDNLGQADAKKIELTLHLPPKVPQFRGDKQRLAVLLHNLVGNAVKYTPEGGKVQVALELADQILRVAVTDTGIGIAPEEQKRVFEKFYRAADERVQMITGTGLGLALAREVARLHGGDIALESTHGKGSTFTIELPLTRGAEVGAA